MCNLFMPYLRPAGKGISGQYPNGHKGPVYDVVGPAPRGERYADITSNGTWRPIRNFKAGSGKFSR